MNDQKEDAERVKTAKIYAHALTNGSYLLRVRGEKGGEKEMR